MPSRVVREQLVSSYSLSRVSVGAELTFVHLLLVVDDYGRTDGRLSMLRAALYPTRDVPFDQLDGWLRELEADGCIERYEVGGRECLALPRWEDHFSRQKRAKSSRFPDPPTPAKEIPGDPRRSPLVVGDECKDLGVEEKNKTAPAPPPRGSPVEIAWQRGVEAAVAYKPSAERWQLTEPRRRHLRALLREQEPRGEDAFAHVVHGYIARHQGANGRFDPMAHFSPETLLAAEKRGERVEAYDEAVAQGRSPPFPVPGKRGRHVRTDTEGIFRGQPGFEDDR